jgi:hypothetical protein
MKLSYVIKRDLLKDVCTVLSNRYFPTSNQQSGVSSCKKYVLQFPLLLHIEHCLY